MNSYYIHQFDSEDSSIYEELARLFNAIDELDNPDHIRLDVSFFKERYHVPESDKSLFLTRDNTGKLIGFGRISKMTEQGEFEIGIYVDPIYRQKGIGEKLLDRILHEAKESGATTLTCNIPSYREYTINFAEKRGFSANWALIKMRHQNIESIQPDFQQDNQVVREIAIHDDVSEWISIQNQIFADHRNYQLATERSIENLTSRKEFMPELALFIEQEGVIAAYCIGLVRISEGDVPTDRILFVHAVGVLPNFRGQGVGEVIMKELLHRGSKMKVGKSELIVDDDNHAAIRMYEKLGYEERYKRIWYSYNFDT